MAKLIAAGVGERTPRDFVIYIVAADGTRTVATLTGLQVFLYKRLPSDVGWSEADSKNTTDDAGELDIVDWIEDEGEPGEVTHTDGAVRLTPPEAWWDAAGKFHIITEVMSTPPYFAPSTEMHEIEVVSRP